MRYPTDITNQFIQLRARDISLGKISEQLGVPKSTLGLWNSHYQAEINHLRRIEWEEVEAEFSSSITQDLKRTLKRIRAAEDELDNRKLQYFDMKELFQLIRETRREYDRKRAILMADAPTFHAEAPAHGAPKSDDGGPAAPSSTDAGLAPLEDATVNANAAHVLPSLPQVNGPAQLDETGRFDENRPDQPRCTNDLQQIPAQPSSSPTPPPAPEIDERPWWERESAKH